MGHGLRCPITEQIRHSSHIADRDEIGDLVTALDRVDAESRSRDTGRLLWVFRERLLEEQIVDVVERRVSAGRLLEYPGCCVEHHEVVQRQFDRAFAQAIVTAVGLDPVAVERALKEDLQVELPENLGDRRNMDRSDQQFPFALNIACDACLASDDSPTAGLHRACRDLTQQVDRRFSDLFEAISRVRVQINALAREAETNGMRPELKSGSSFVPGTRQNLFTVC
jgi:hypothetical protein